MATVCRETNSAVNLVKPIYFLGRQAESEEPYYRLESSSVIRLAMPGIGNRASPRVVPQAHNCDAALTSAGAGPGSSSDYAFLASQRVVTNL